MFENLLNYTMQHVQQEEFHIICFLKKSLSRYRYFTMTTLSISFSKAATFGKMFITELFNQC